MSFNSNSYFLNKARRRGLEHLEQGRDIKRRAAAGEAYEWELARLPLLVTLARLEWRTYLSYLRIDRMNVDHRRMTAADFIAKYRKD